MRYVLGLLVVVALQSSAAADALKVDIMLVLDESGSISSGDFAIEKDFSSSLVSTFSVGADAAMFGVVGFASSARQLFPLSANGSVLVDTINSMTQQGGEPTSIEAGLLAAQGALVAGGRADAADIIILLSDGLAGSGDAATAAADLRNSGVTILAVPIGANADAAALEELTGSPDNVVGLNPSALAQAILSAATTDPSPVPEPGTLALVGVMVLGGAMVRRARRSSAA